MATEPVFLASPTNIFTFPRIGTRSSFLMSACLLASDLTALLIVSCAGVVMRHFLAAGYPLSAFLKFIPFLAILLPAFLSQRLYPGLLIHPAEEIRRIFRSLSIVLLIWASASFLFRIGELYSRSVFLLIWALSTPVIILCRTMVRRWLSRKSWWGVSAVILGSGPTARRVIRKLQDGRLGIKIVGVFSEHDTESDADMPQALGDLNSARFVADAGVVQYAILAVPNKSNLELGAAIRDCCRGFRHVLLVPDLPDVCSLGVTACDIGGELGLELPQLLFHRNASFIKRIIDCAASSFILLVAGPLMLLIAFLVKLTSKGPALFCDRRLGRDGRTFQAYKFRTMVPGANTILAEYLAANPAALAEWQRDRKLKEDPRITWVGKWLRRYSLDELPQILNVLFGQMSLVGPRPLPPSDLEKYGTGINMFTRVPPGLTGLWQVSGRNNTTYEERISLDEFYVRNWSIWLDLYILVRTVRAVITADGAY